MNESSHRDWIGRSETVEELVTETPLKAMLATLGRQTADTLPLKKVPALWHWLYFLELASWHKLAADGHQQRGVFLPPIDLPRRMWAGSEVQFHSPLLVNTESRRESTISNIEEKQGRSGKLAFVTVKHEIYCADRLAITETQTIVYREAASDARPAGGQAAPIDPDFTHTISPDPLLLFRYSALTFNAHRIHYDRPYATETEGYPGLVVHGPLLATMLMDLLLSEHPQANIESFEFRAVKPVFDLAPFQVCGNKPNEDGLCELWIADADNTLCMRATAKLKSNEG
jgi:3-methylfumaryl-CoA hydratase